MQTELRETYPQLQISLLGINEEGHEYGSAVVAEQGDIPWLQDIDANNNDVSDVWYDLWQISFRDVLVLDGDNVPVATFNLGEANLGEAVHYEALRDLLLDTAMAWQKPYQNPANPLDVDGNGLVIPLDVLTIINEINLSDSYELPPLEGPTPPSIFYDTNGDGAVTPLDVLQVVNYLNGLTVASGGEAEPAVEPGPAVPMVEAVAAEPDAGEGIPDAAPAIGFAFDGQALALRWPAAAARTAAGDHLGEPFGRLAPLTGPAVDDRPALVDRVFARFAASADESPFDRGARQWVPTCVSGD